MAYVDSRSRNPMEIFSYFCHTGGFSEYCFHIDKSEKMGMTTKKPFPLCSFAFRAPLVNLLEITITCACSFKTSGEH